MLLRLLLCLWRLLWWLLDLGIPTISRIASIVHCSRILCNRSIPVSLISLSITIVSTAIVLALLHLRLKLNKCNTSILVASLVYFSNYFKQY
ncbi:hypothetical protein Hanom_Chr01g00044051 [Helianthus anomalus]